MAGLTNAQILLVRNLADWTGPPDQLRLLARAVVQEDKTTKKDAIAYASILGLRGGFCIPLNNVSYKRENAMDFPRGGIWCQCAPLTDLVDRVKALTER